MSRRGFVMPIILTLSIAIGLVAGVVLARSAQRAAVVRDQLTAYQTSHRERGVREIVVAWLTLSDRQDLSELAGGDRGGDAFTLRISPGESISVRLAPAQTTARINPIGLNVSDGIAARRIETILLDRFGEQGLASRSREVGPAAVDAALAPDDVVAAVAEAVLEDADLAGRFVSQLRRQDTTNGIDAATVKNAASAVGIEAEPADRLSMLLGARPTLWSVRAEWTRMDPASPTGRRRDEYRGVFLWEPGEASQNGTRSASETFLEWGRVEEADGYTERRGGFGRPGA